MTAIVDARNWPVDDAALDAAEARIGFSIPHAYRDFLLHYNGGSPEPGVFDFLQGGETNDSVVHYFFSIDPHDPHYNLEHELAAYAGRYPPDTCPIACDPVGNLILVGRDGSPRAGKVLFWDHEAEADEGENADDRNVHLVADSFEQFLSMLHDEPVDKP